MTVHDAAVEYSWIQSFAARGGNLERTSHLRRLKATMKLIEVDGGRRVCAAVGHLQTSSDSTCDEENSAEMVQDIRPVQYSDQGSVE